MVGLAFDLEEYCLDTEEGFLLGLEDRNLEEALGEYFSIRDVLELEELEAYLLVL